MSRIFIKAKDLQILYGCSDRTATTVIKKIRISLGKTNKQPITFSEYCKYENIDLSEIKFLNIE